MLIYFALESQTQKQLRSIILHKIIFVNVLHFDLSCWPMDESNMVFHQYIQMILSPTQIGRFGLLNRISCTEIGRIFLGPIFPEV